MQKFNLIRCVGLDEQMHSRGYTEINLEKKAFNFLMIYVFFFRFLLCLFRVSVFMQRNFLERGWD